MDTIDYVGNVIGEKMKVSREQEQHLNNEFKDITQEIKQFRMMAEKFSEYLKEYQGHLESIKQIKCELKITMEQAQRLQSALEDTAHPIVPVLKGAAFFVGILVSSYVMVKVLGY